VSSSDNRRRTQTAGAPHRVGSSAPAFPTKFREGVRESARRRRLTLGALGLLAIAVVSVLAGCATTVTPPAGVRDPVKVYLADYGRHSSLILPRPDEVLVEFEFGEWRWFALDQTGFWDAWRALCWPSAGTLGRRELTAETAAALRAGALGQELFELAVERERADALLRQLDLRWTRNAATAVYHARYDLHFVRDNQSYHLLHNCNPAVAGWLRELGCAVRGPALLSNWRVRPLPK
jgi:hypothetical protein